MKDNLLILYNPYYGEGIIEQHLAILKDKEVVGFGKIYPKNKDMEHPNQARLQEIYKNTSPSNPLQLFLTDYANLFVAVGTYQHDYKQRGLAILAMGSFFVSWH